MQGGRPPPGDDLRFSNTTGILLKKTMWFIGVGVEQETSAPPPKNNPGSAPEIQRALESVTCIVQYKSSQFLGPCHYM